MASERPARDVNPFIIPAFFQPGSETFKGFLAGAIVGSSELFLSYPMELIKTQLQLDKSNKPGRFTGVVNTMVRIVRKDGILGLYRGLGIVLIFKTPQESIRFGVYEELKSRMPMDETGKVPSSSLFFCGLGAGVSEAIIVVTPSEALKVKLIHDQRSVNPRYKGFLFNGVVKLIKAEGFKGLYHGLTPTVLKQGSNHAIRFFVVDYLKNRYCKMKSTDKIPAPVIGIFGVIAGCTSVALNNPVDVMKTRMQGFHAVQYSGILHCVRKIYSDEGSCAFYKGSAARAIRVSLDAGFTFMCYDLVMDFLAEYCDADRPFERSK